VENVSTLVHAQFILQRSSLFNKRSKHLFSSVHLEGTEEYFFSSYFICLFIFQYVGVIFNHNTVHGFTVVVALQYWSKNKS